MFNQLESIGARPNVFSAYTAEDLWADPHISKQMLACHLDGNVALASRTSAFIDSSLGWLAAEVQISPGADVLDLGCGPGLYANPLAARGAQVVGVDFSERSLRHARSAAPEGGSAPAYIHGNYLDVEIPGTFDVVLLAMCDYCALSPSQRQRLLKRVCSLLRPDGRFVFDVYGLASMRSREEAVTYQPGLMDGFWSAEPYHGFLHTFLYDRERVILDKYEIVDANRSRTIYNWLQCFDLDSIEQELDRGGLEISAFFGDLTGANLEADPFEFCVVAKPRLERRV